MVLAMLPMFLLAIDEKNGQPLEVIIRQFVEVKFLRPKERPYQTNNFYTALARQERLDKEVRAIVKGKGKDPNKKRKLTRQEKKQIDALIRQSKGDGKPIRRRTAYRLNECIRTGFAALQTGGIPSALSLKILTISLRSRTTRPAIFEALCDMYNSLTLYQCAAFLNQPHANKEDFKSSITIAPQNDDFDSIRAEYTEMLQTQLERGNNGLIKTKFLTFTIEAKDIKSARARLARIETDTLTILR